MIRQIEKVALPQFSADGSLLAGAEFANYRPDTIRLWKVPGGEVAATFGKQLRPPLVLSPGGEMGAVLSGFSVQLLRIPSGQFITALSASARPNVRLLVTGFSPDGKMVAAGDESGLVWNWQVENRRLLFVMEGHKKEISALAFSADNQTLVSLSQDGGVRLWKAADGKLVRAVNAAELVVKQPGMEETTFGLATGVALSPDGRLLAVGGFLNPQQAPPGKAGVTLLVDAETGQLVRLLRGGGGMVLFSPDGKLLYTSGDGAVRVWGVLP
jgi:WD40 repeat protein